MCPQQFRNILCPQQMFPSLRSMETQHSFCVPRVCAPKKHHEQQCVHNKVSSFASTLRPWQTRTHCCGHIVADTNVSPFARARNICCGHTFCVRGTKNVSDFVQKHFVSATNVSQFAQHKKHHEQKCVRNNVSSFASTLRPLLVSLQCFELVSLRCLKLY